MSGPAENSINHFVHWFLYKGCFRMVMDEWQKKMCQSLPNRDTWAALAASVTQVSHVCSSNPRHILIYILAHLNLPIGPEQFSKGRTSLMYQQTLFYKSKLNMLLTTVVNLSVTCDLN